MVKHIHTEGYAASEIYKHFVILNKIVPIKLGKIWKICNKAELNHLETLELYCPGPYYRGHMH